MRVATWKGPFPGPASRPGRRPLIHATTSITPLPVGEGAGAACGRAHRRRTRYEEHHPHRRRHGPPEPVRRDRVGRRPGGRTGRHAARLSVEDGFPVAQRSQGSQLAVEPVAFGLFAQFPLPDLVVVGVQPLVGPDLPVEASQPADAGHDGAVRTCQRMVDDDLETGRPLVGDGEPGSVGQRLIFAHEPSALLVPFAQMQRERPVLMFLVHDRLLFRNPKARCPGRAWWPRRFCVRSTMPRRSSAAPVCVVRRTRHDPRYARGGQARRPG